MGLLKKFIEIYKSKHAHFLFVDFNFYKKWKWILRIIIFLNKNYVSCEIFRKEYKIHKNFVVIGLKWNGRNVKRRTSGYAKGFISEHEETKCIYCESELNMNNVTSDHIIPISNKGNNCQVNIIVCCTDCNNQRGNIPFNEYLKFKNPKYLNQKFIFI